MFLGKTRGGVLGAYKVLGIQQAQGYMGSRGRADGRIKGGRTGGGMGEREGVFRWQKLMLSALQQAVLLKLTRRQSMLLNPLQ